MRNKITRGEFNRCFDNFINEIKGLAWDEWKTRISFTADTAAGWFIESKERYYTTISLLPDSILNADTGLEIGLGFFTAFMQAQGIKTAATGKNLHIWQVWASQKGIDARENDIMDGLPFADSSFEVVYCCEVMEHILGYPEDYMKELYRVLKPGGHMVLTTPNLHRLSNKVRFLLGKNYLGPLVKTYDGTNHIREFDISELEKYLSNAGFNIKTLETFNYYKSLKERLVYQLFNLPGWRRNIMAICLKQASSDC